jgi:P-type Ca2+ transporter type 2C
MILTQDERAEQTSSPDWHTLTAEQTLHRLSSIESGLEPEEAERRLKQHGFNRLTEASRPTFLHLVWDQLNNFIVILLVIAAIVSGLLGEWAEAAAITAIVVLNAILGVVQEQRAEEALAALKKLSAPEAHGLRGGRRISIPSEELVPGDIVFLEAGNFIPADVRLLEAVNLQIEEASLTGESLPVNKNAALVLDSDASIGDRKNTAFMGTIVTYGRGRGVVVSTGMTTQLGLIAEMLQSVETEQTPLQQQLNRLGKILGWMALAICALVFFAGLIQGDYWLDMFLIAVSLAVAAVPEGLPAVVTISLALGMREMIRRHALIRRLSSVETLGSATTICSDKTGTLTQNEMTVTRLWVVGQLFEVSGTGYSAQGGFRVDGSDVALDDYPAAQTALWLGALNNDAHLEPLEEDPDAFRIAGDPTEGALLIVAAKAGIAYPELGGTFPRASEVPFDSERKRMVTVHDIRAPHPSDPSPFTERHKNWNVVTVKGAPDVVLDLCTGYQAMDDTSRRLDDKTRHEILAANDAMTRDALRVLAVAYRSERAALDESGIPTEELERDLIFVGLFGMIDPPREQVKPALALARGAGIRTVMITGDYPNTARAIAESIGLLLPGHRVMTGAELDQLSNEQLNTVIEKTDVFARVSPEHKLRIVNALQANDEVVAMTGDGVNDAPAIKRADIGVAMGITGTDVAKQTADMVLTDDNYASIVAAVEQGRVIYGNIRKFVFFLLSSNVAEIMIIFLATLAGLPPPLTAIQLLWLNLITDGAPALALAREKGDPDIMKRKPRPKREPIVHGPMRLGIIVQTIAQTTVVLGAFIVGLYWHLEAGAVIPAGANPVAYVLQHDWTGVDVQTAETMAFVTLSLCELFRAYTVRTSKASVFKIGVFSNRYMQYAVGLSIGLLLGVTVIPFFQPIFNTHTMNAKEWAVVLTLALMPAVAEELTKWYLRWQDRRAGAAA